MFEQLQTHRQLLFDLTANYLDPLDNMFARLAYLAGLRDPATGNYAHERLAAMYGEQRVDEVLQKCHEEIFERLLEMPLGAQEDGLRRLVASWEGSFLENVQLCGEKGQSWIPAKAPNYLIELYSSNLNALVELLRDNTAMVR